MNTTNAALTLLVSSLWLAGCGQGSNSTPTLPFNDIGDAPVDSLALGNNPIESPITALPSPVVNEAPIAELDDELGISDQARYRVTLENMWGADDFPQGFPADAHLSLIGGATHSVAVSFWEVGEVASRGVEDMAETGLIDILLFDEVAPAIANGTAGSMIEVREFTDPQIDGVPGALEFDLTMNSQWPQVSFVTMLGPSPDWFVGVSGLSLLNDGGWETVLSVDLPVYDGGSKSDITPIMGGPDIIPPNPIELVAYNADTGVYLPSDEPQYIARVTFVKIN